MKDGFYYVVIGRKTGRFDSWKECKEQVKGFPNADYRKFKHSEVDEIEDYIERAISLYEAKKDVDELLESELDKIQPEILDKLDDIFMIDAISTFYDYDEIKKKLADKLINECWI